MSVEFQEDNFNPGGYNTDIIKTNKFGMYLIKKKIAKDAKQANLIMLTAAIIFFALSGLIFKSLVAQELPEIIPYDQLTDTQKAKIPGPAKELIEAVKNKI